jgi:hypothetical protein
LISFKSEILMLKKLAIIDKHLIQQSLRGFNFYVRKLSCPINDISKLPTYHFISMAMVYRE